MNVVSDMLRQADPLSDDSRRLDEARDEIRRTVVAAASVARPLSGDPDAHGSRGISRRTRSWLAMGAVLVALVLLAMLSGPGADPDAPPSAADAGGGASAAVGQDAPLHFTLKDAYGADVNLASFKGKVILVNFWATWCGPCRVEIPDLIKLQDAYRNDLVVLGIDVQDEFDRVPEFRDRLKINYPLVNGNDRKDVEDAYGPMWGLPTSVIIGRDGKIQRKHSGIASREQFEQYIEPLL